MSIAVAQYLHNDNQKDPLSILKMLLKQVFWDNEKMGDPNTVRYLHPPPRNLTFSQLLRMEPATSRYCYLIFAIGKCLLLLYNIHNLKSIKINKKITISPVY